MEYEIKRSKRKTITLHIKRGALIVRAPWRMTNAAIERFVEAHSDWIEKNMKSAFLREEKFSDVKKLSEQELNDLKKRARSVFEERAAHFAPLIGVTYGKITVRAQKTRWGSCSSNGNLNFNCLLLLAPPEVLDCIVVHELCHRKQMNHSDSFYREVLRVFPEYHKHHAWLKDNGEGLIRLLPNE